MVYSKKKSWYVYKQNKFFVVIFGREMYQKSNMKSNASKRKILMLELYLFQPFTRAVQTNFQTVNSSFFF